MLELAIAAIVSALGVPPDAVALARTAPTYLSDTSAAEHLVAARAAGAEVGVDADLLLSIAWHESRYSLTRTPEAGGLMSCGVMTPEPRRSCPVEDLWESYRAGARHLRGWMVAMHGDLKQALIGYAGGYRLIDFCAAGGIARGCDAPEVFLSRAWEIKRQRRRHAVS